MIEVRPPRDWFSTLAGLGVATALAIALGYAFWGPAVRIAVSGWHEVWVTVVPPGPAAVHGKPASSGHA